MQYYLPVSCIFCFLSQLHCALCFLCHHYHWSRLSFLEMILSVLSFGNFFHFNVTTQNYWNPQQHSLCDWNRPLWRACTVFLPFSYYSHCYFTSFIIIMPLPYVCDEFPFLYFAQHWYKRHVTSSVTIHLYLCFNVFSQLFFLLKSSWAPFRPLKLFLRSQPALGCRSGSRQWSPGLLAPTTPQGCSSMSLA